MQDAGCSVKLPDLFELSGLIVGAHNGVYEAKADIPVASQATYLNDDMSVFIYHQRAENRWCLCLAIDNCENINMVREATFTGDRGVAYEVTARLGNSLTWIQADGTPCRFR